MKETEEEYHKRMEDLSKKWKEKPAVQSTVAGFLRETLMGQLERAETVSEIKSVLRKGLLSIAITDPFTEMLPKEAS